MKTFSQRLINFVVGCIFTVMAIMTFMDTSALPGHSGMFPKTIAVILLMLSLGVLVQTALGKYTEQSINFNWREIVNFLILVSAYFLIPFLGFYTCTALMIWVIYLFGVGSIKIRHIAKGGGMAVVVGTILYLLFHILMQVQTPTGLLI